METTMGILNSNRLLINLERIKSMNLAKEEKASLDFKDLQQLYNIMDWMSLMDPKFNKLHPFNPLNQLIKLFNLQLKQNNLNRKYRQMIFKYLTKNFKLKRQLKFLHLYKQISLIRKINLCKWEQLIPNLMRLKFKLSSLTI